MSISDGARGARVATSNTGQDLRATSDVDGTYILGRNGNDTLRGGEYDDILEGGKGNDAAWGGLGADQFRFRLPDMVAGDLDNVRDLNFSEGDFISFIGFSAGTFTGLDQSIVNGTGIRIESYADLAALLNSDDAGANKWDARAVGGSTGKFEVTYDTGGGNLYRVQFFGESVDGKNPWQQLVDAGFGAVSG